MVNIAHQISLIGLGGVQSSFATYYRLALEKSVFKHGIFGLHPKDARFADLRGYRNMKRDPFGLLKFLTILHSRNGLVHFYNNLGSHAVRKLLRLFPATTYIFHERGVAWNLPTTEGNVVQDNAAGAKIIVTNSHATKTLLIHKFDLRQAKFKVLYNGVLDLEKLPDPYNSISSSSTVRVGYLGRFDTHKGVHILIETARHLAKEQGIEFLIAGSGPLEKWLKNQALDLPNIRFLGAVTNPYKFLSNIDILCAPSIREPLGNAIIEAGYMRKAVIASFVDGIPEIIKNGVSGILIKPKKPLRKISLPEKAAPYPEVVVSPDKQLIEPKEIDASELASNIEKLASDYDTRIALGEKLFKKVINYFSVNKYYEELEDIYRTILIA